MFTQKKIFLLFLFSFIYLCKTSPVFDSNLDNEEPSFERSNGDMNVDLNDFNFEGPPLNDDDNSNISNQNENNQSVESGDEDQIENNPNVKDNSENQNEENNEEVEQQNQGKERNYNNRPKYQDSGAEDENTNSVRSIDFDAPFELNQKKREHSRMNKKQFVYNPESENTNSEELNGSDQNRPRFNVPNSSLNLEQIDEPIIALNGPQQQKNRRPMSGRNNIRENNSQNGGKYTDILQNNGAPGFILPGSVNHMHERKINKYLRNSQSFKELAGIAEQSSDKLYVMNSTLPKLTNSIPSKKMHDEKNSN